jgi:DNA-binding NarL/FixJ family response regulator
MPNRILVADPHEAMRARIRTILEGAGWKVIGEAVNGHDLLEKVKELAPDLVVLDLYLPVKGGLEAATEILKYFPSTKLLVFTVHEDEHIRNEALRIGLHGYALKSSAASLLAEVNRILGMPA